MYYKKFKNIDSFETVDEFLSRGGTIDTSKKDGIVRKQRKLKQPTILNNDYSNKEFEERLHRFYNSKRWKLIKEQVYKTHAHLCPVCGSEENLRVDHIKPIRHYPALIDDMNNLQILCNECNLEKGSMIDWSLGWHIANKSILEEKQKLIELKKLKEPKKNEEEFSKKIEILRTFESWQLDDIFRAWNAYCSRMNKAGMDIINQYDFIEHIKFHVRDIRLAKKYVQDNWRNITSEPTTEFKLKPKEFKLKPKEFKQSKLHRVTKDGRIIVVNSGKK